MIAYYPLPIGLIRIEGNEYGIRELKFVEEKLFPERDKLNHNILSLFTQLDEYFAGKRRNFEIELEVMGTEFQKRVWNELLKIPYGEVVTYNDIALIVGDKKLVRAVASAIARNRLMIVIPCHRVIGSNGKLTGYAGGLERKSWLLNHEKFYKSALYK